LGGAGEEGAALAEKLQNQRERLFRAMAIVDACRLGSQSFLAPLPGGLDYHYALLAAHELISGCASQLEAIASSAKRCGGS